MKEKSPPEQPTILGNYADSHVTFNIDNKVSIRKILVTSEDCRKLATWLNYIAGLLEYKEREKKGE